MPQNHITDEQLARLRQALLDQKAEIEADRSAYVSEEQADSEEQAGGELSDYDPNDPADEATALFDHERNRAAEDNMTRILGKIDRALQKMDEGTYGLSEVDGTPIPVERLEALPYALATVEQEDSL